MSVSLTALLSVLVLVVLIAMFGSYRVLKWPIFLALGSLLCLEFSCYLVLRYIVASSEFLLLRISTLLQCSFSIFAPNSSAVRLHALTVHEESATTFEQWREAALGLDALEGREEWKASHRTRFYDSAFIRSLLTELRIAMALVPSSTFLTSSSNFLSPPASHSLMSGREEDDRREEGDRREERDEPPLFPGQERLRDAILAAVHKNIAGIETPELYQSHFGTKVQIEEFVAASAEALRVYYGCCSGEQKMGEKGTMRTIGESQMAEAHATLEFYQRLRRAYGRVALCLSGGGALGNYHWGVVRVLLDQKELPSVISGTSAGALAAAFVGTRTDEELDKALRPELMAEAMQGMFSESLWMMARRWWRSGGLLDSDAIEQQLLRVTKGPTTFLEAFRRTGRRLNISVQPSGKYRTTMVFNHLTTPDVIVASAIMASAAVPGMLDRPVVLKKKCPYSGAVSHYQQGTRWSDGSFQGDIPMQTLRELFSCSYFVVSQVNPHIAPFFYSPRGETGYSRTRGRLWRGGFVGSAFEAFFKLEMQKNLQLISELDLLPAFLGQNWSQLFLQEFEGQVTIVPQLSPADYLNLISDPTLPRMRHYFRNGSLQAWRILSKIKTRSVVASTIEECEKLAKARLKEWSRLFHKTRGFLYSPNHP